MTPSHQIKLGLKIVKKIGKKLIKPSTMKFDNTNPSLHPELYKLLLQNNKNNPYDLIDKEMKLFRDQFAQTLAVNDKWLYKVVKYVLENKGKKIRPALCILFSKIIENNDKTISYNQFKLSEVCELVHTGSILHDDVIDKSDYRRGNESVSKKFGNKIAILGGDFLLAKASELLSIIGDKELIKFIANTLMDLVKGETMNIDIRNSNDFDKIINEYFLKNFLKTGSLIANSCKGIIHLVTNKDELIKSAFEFGKNFGLAFQIKDDIIDIENNSISIGKPKLKDIKTGVITAPILFAAKDHSELWKIFQRKFTEDGDVEKVIKSINKSSALEKTQKLVESFSVNAIKNLSAFPDSIYKEALISVVRFNLNRKK